MLGLFVTVVLWRECWARETRDVVTSQGVVRGYFAPRPPHFAYLGVPYARPTHHDRFKAPKPPRPWDGTFEATHRVRCRQPDGSGTEDCLVVNVFAPEHGVAAPVLVLVHGGDFQDGWGPVRPPSRLLSKDLVIVTFNYRVGVFGFLCLGVPDAPGNAGLKDQVAALYWVHRNIVNFGGNLYDVTLHGIGAGAASVQFLLMSGSAKGLFHKVIIESGTALSPLSLSYTPLLSAADAAMQLGYRGSDSAQELANFYKDLPSSKLVNITNLYLPCLENNLETTHSLLERDPVEILKAGDYQMVPMLIAYRDGAGAANFEQDIKKFAYVPDNFENMLPNNLEFDNEAVKKKVTDLVKNFYFGKITLAETVRKNYMDYINDVTYEYPIVRSASLYALKNSLPVYFIKFTHEVGSQTSIETKKPLDIFDYFYDHLVDIYDPKAARLITLWSNFIKIGDPTPLTTFLVPEVLQPIQVKRNNELDIKKIMGLSLSKSMHMQNLADNKIIFWDHIYNRFYRIHRAYFSMHLE